MADNFSIDIVSIGSNALHLALGLAWDTHGVQDRRRAVAYSIVPNKGLIFHWSVSGSSTPLPFKLDLAGAVDFTERWLAEQDYGREPDIDGTCKRGWQVYNEGWARIGDDWTSFVAIRPHWLLYGK